MSEKAVEVLQSIDYHSYVPTFLPAGLQVALHDFIDDFDVFKIFRLLIIVYLYVIARRTYTNYAKKKQIERQLQLDREAKAKGKTEEEEAKLQEEDEGKPKIDDQSWGWGKRTRRKVHKQEAAFAEKLKELETNTVDTAYNPDSDDDIADLLED